MQPWGTNSRASSKAGVQGAFLPLVAALLPGGQCQSAVDPGGSGEAMLPRLFDEPARLD